MWTFPLICSSSTIKMLMSDDDMRLSILVICAALTDRRLPGGAGWQEGQSVLPLVWAVAAVGLLKPELANCRESSHCKGTY